MTQALTCPGCGAELPARVPAACPTCQIRLNGPDAMRLWQIDQVITQLGTERVALLASMRGPVPTALPTPHSTGTLSEPGDPGGRGVPAPLPQPRRHRPRLSGQQVLLTLGAMLLLSAVAFFVVVAWLVVGVVGQAVIVVCLVAAAVTGSVAATRHRLGATAEAAAVLAVGLSWIAAAGAHHLNLAGLGHWDVAWFWTVAHGALAALFVGYQRLIPRVRIVNGEARALLPVLTYRPCAAAALCLVPWSALIALDLSTTPLIAGLGVAAILQAGLALTLAVRTAGAAAVPRPRSTAAAIAVASIAAAASAAAFWAVGCSQALDATEGFGARYSAGALLAVPALVAVLASLLVDRPARDQNVPRWLRSHLRDAAAVAAMPVALVPLFDLPQVGVVVLAAALALAAPWLWVHGSAAGWARAGLLLVTFGQAATWLIAVALISDDASSIRDAVMTSDTAAPLPVLVGLAPAGFWAVSCAVAAWRTWPALCGLGNLALGQIVVLWAAFFSTGYLAPGDVVILLVSLALTDALAASGLARRGARHRPLLPDRDRWCWAELILASGAALLGLVAVIEADQVTGSAWVSPVVLAVLALAAFFYATAPRRFLVAYLGAVLAGLAWLIQLDNTTSSYPVEWFTLPCAGLLALLGALHAWIERARRLPSVLIAGPALAVALLPSTAIIDGPLRLIAVVAAGLVLVAVGYARSWQAPILIGGLALTWVAIAQGGPYLSYVPTWLTLAVAGAVLLTGGVLWERAVQAGKRSAGWFAELG